MPTRRLVAVVALVGTGAVAAAAVNESGRSSSRASYSSDDRPIRTAEHSTRAHSEKQVRDEIAQRVHQNLMALEFDELDATEAAYLKTGELTPAGVPKLGEFHGGVQYSLPKAFPSAGCRLSAEPLLDMWQAKSPTSATQYFARASALIDRAWCFRGHGSASQVSEAAMESFDENIEAAEDVLRAHEQIVAKDPEYYYLMTAIYRSEGRSRAEFDALMRKATAAAPYYYRIYWAAFDYNLPQWFGSVQDVDAAATYAVQRTHAKDGFGAYARFYWYASAQGCNCWKSSINWPTMKRAMRDVADRYPEPWNLANFAKISCEMEDSATAKAYFAALGSDDGSAAWPNDRENWEKCRQMAGV